jgi:hypothetical protein
MAAESMVQNLSRTQSGLLVVEAFGAEVLRGIAGMGLSLKLLATFIVGEVSRGGGGTRVSVGPISAFSVGKVSRGGGKAASAGSGFQCTSYSSSCINQWGGVTESGGC